MNNRILAQGVIISDDSIQSQLNNNDVIIGPSGSGKTRGYVMPNVLECGHSMVVVDTKGNLSKKMGNYLRNKGYVVKDLNFKEPLNSCGYNPMAYIRYDKKRKKYNEQDINTLAHNIDPSMDTREPFWDESARIVIAALIAFVLEKTEMKYHNLHRVAAFAGKYSHVLFDGLFGDLEKENPDSYAVKKYNMFKNLSSADRTEACVMQFVNTALDCFNFEGAEHIMTNKDKIDIRMLGKQKTALFIEVSDSDRSMDRFVNVFLSQLFEQLIRLADSQRNNRLAIPVRIIMDDFATNACIEDFDNIMSVIRSRGIYASIILQNISQLNSKYGAEKARTILMNADHMLYLGGRDVVTAEYISAMSNIPLHRILDMPLSEAICFERGSKARKVIRYDISMHRDAAKIGEAVLHDIKANDMYGKDVVA